MRYVYRVFDDGKVTLTADHPVVGGITYADSFLHEDFSEREALIRGNPENIVVDYVPRSEDDDSIAVEID